LSEGAAGKGHHPEVRIDQLTGLRAILAPGRAERPDAFAAEPAVPRPDARATCPFCEGEEGRTPLEVWANRPGGEPNTPGWKQRSVPNLYPVLEEPEEDPDAGSAAGAAAGRGRESGFASSIDPLHASTRGAESELFRAQPAHGAHEVIVHTPRHVSSLSALDDDELTGAVGAWRERMRAHGGAAYIHVIVNEGPDAGASLEHTHAQLYALGFVPATVARERERATAYHERTMGAHLLPDVATEEVRLRDRLVSIDDDAILFCPWASRSPFELRIVPRAPEPRFEDADAGPATLRTALRALGAALGVVPQLNLWVRTAPRGTDEFCWHIDIVPRLTIRAGFELGTGVDINIYPPERAAADLRAALG
jgi:UDPglucose--hexose-1-phosphate uridylyltransferase